MTWDKKRALCPFFVHPPTLQMLSCITRGEHEKYRESVLSHQLRISYTPAFYQIRVSQMGIVG